MADRVGYLGATLTKGVRTQAMPYHLEYFSSRNSISHQSGIHAVEASADRIVSFIGCMYNAWCETLADGAIRAHTTRCSFSFPGPDVLCSFS